MGHPPSQPTAPSVTTGRRWRVLSLLALAAIFTLLNAVKPLHIDDAAYYYYARHIAYHPLDPYGFTVFWYEHPQPANKVLAPPVLPYWWAAGIRLFGDHVVAWKLWLLPFSALFVLALDALFRRFAPGLATPLVWTTVLSPTFLPSLNLMLDVPALGLGLSALAVFFAAFERRSWPMLLLSGLTAGLATQTKYTAFLAPATMVLFALVQGATAPGASWRSVAAACLVGLVPAVLAGAVFAGWEGFVAWRYPEQGSHFLFHLADNTDPLLDKLTFWSGPLLALVGSVASVVGLLGLAALGCRGRVVAAGAVALVLALSAVAVFDGDVTGWPGPDAILPGGEWAGGEMRWEPVLFGLLGAGTMVVTGAVAWRLLRLSRGGWRPASWHGHRLEWFLAAWLALELAGYFALTPFGAVRRIMGLVVVGTLVVGRLASRTCRHGGRRRLVLALTAGNIALGLAFYGIDLREAQARRDAAELAAAYVRTHDAAATAWFVGHWEFQFYAERAGLKPAVAGRSYLRRGDWLIVPDGGVEKQSVSLDDRRLQLRHTVRVSDRLPWRTVWGFYGTATGAALEHRAGPRVEVKLYQVTADHWLQPG